MHNIFSRSLARVLKLNFVYRFKSRCSVIAYYLLLELVEQRGLKVLYLPTLIILCTFKQGEGISKQNKTRRYYTDNTSSKYRQ